MHPHENVSHLLNSERKGNGVVLSPFLLFGSHRMLIWWVLGGFRAWDVPVTGGTVSYQVPLPTLEPVNLTIPEVPVINFVPVNVTIPTLGLPLPLWLQNTTSPAAAATPPPRLTSSPPP